MVFQTYQLDIYSTIVSTEKDGVVMALLLEAHNAPPIYRYASASIKEYLYSFSIFVAHMAMSLGIGNKTIFASLKQLLLSSIRGRPRLCVQARSGMEASVEADYR